MPREPWQASRRPKDLEGDQVAASNSKPFGNAACLLKFLCWLKFDAEGVHGKGAKSKKPKQPKKMGPKKTLVKQLYRCKKCGQPKRGHKCLS